MKRSTSVPVPSSRMASVRTQGRSMEWTDSTSPATAARRRGMSAAMTVVVLTS